MRLTEQDVESFKDLYRKVFNIEITNEEALRQATALVSLVKQVYRPMTRKEWKQTIAKMVKDE